MALKVNGAAIKALRQEQGISQEVLGWRAGVSRQAISQAERGENGLRPPVLRLVALGLGVTVDQIATRVPEPEPEPEAAAS